MKALVGAFNQEKALVGAFSVIVQPVVEPMDRFAALLVTVTWVWPVSVCNVEHVTVVTRHIAHQDLVTVVTAPRSHDGCTSLSIVFVYLC